ncbi:hypothetical protein BS78_03G395500 [Paspalum vaginatum]|nr:hypothetical protein BS78_03G395500 [Paspalum vaginatum]
MASRRTTAPLIKRRLKASTTCFAPETYQACGGGGEPALFAVQLRCHVSKHIRAGPGWKLDLTCRGGSGTASFVAGAPEDVPRDEAGVRDALRRTLRTVPALRELDLTDDEWDAVVPEDVVAPLADMARRRGCGGVDGSRAAAVDLAVDRYVRFSAPAVLLTACSEGAEEGGGDDGCSICFDALQRREEEEEEEGGGHVELPGCAHAFHRRCISKWFDRKATCPICRGDVTKHLDPDLRKHFDELSPPPDPPANVAAPPCEP